MKLNGMKNGLIIMILLGLTGCGANNPAAPKASPAMGKMNFALQAVGSVYSGKISIRKNAVVLEQTVAVIQGTATVTFSNVQVGTWSIAVQLFDRSGQEVYHGEGEATVRLGETTTLSITVVPNTGNLQITVVVPNEPTPTVTATPTPAGGLVFWNKLGSADEVLHSAYGPGLKIYDPSDPIVIFSPAMLATPAYVAGMFGNAATIGGLADYSNPNRSSCAFELDNPGAVLNPEHGTISFWYLQKGDPTFGVCGALYPVVNNDIAIYSYHKPYNFYYSVVFGAQSASTINTDISAYNYQWIHIAAVWDRAGIQGSADAMRLYINGNIVAVSTDNHWGTTVTQPKLRVMAGVDVGVVGKWNMDNLKIYNFAKTDFSDRSTE